MTRKQAIKSIIYGIELVEGMKDKIDIIGTGDMGIGNTTPSSAIVSVITGSEVENVTGRGTGISDEIYKRKIEVIKRGINLNKPNLDDPIDTLSKVGGLKLGGFQE
jgi:NaMN:DMB phosphoribosyltransferase